jgi:hypothetical protein
MPGSKQDDEEDYLSARDIGKWAQREIKEATKALELRTKDLTELVRAYSEGEITPQKANELHSRYYRRWGEALSGVIASESLTDDQILSAIDQAVDSAHGSRPRFAERLRGKGGTPQSELP